MDEQEVLMVLDVHQVKRGARKLLPPEATQSPQALAEALAQLKKTDPWLFPRSGCCPE